MAGVTATPGPAKPTIPSGGVRRRLDTAFVLAAIARLRTRGVLVSPSDGLACLALLRQKLDWTDEEIATAFESVVARRPGEIGIVNDVIGDLLLNHAAEPRPVFEKVEPVGKRAIDSRVEGPPPKPWWKRVLDHAQSGADKGLRALSASWQRLPRPGPRLIRTATYAGLVVAALLIAKYLWRYVPAYLLRYVPAPVIQQVVKIVDPNTVFAAIDGVDAALSAVSLTGLALLLWRAVILRRPPPEPAPPPSSEDEWEPIAPTPDGTIFRIGSLGGAPSAFLPETIGIEIAEMLGYRIGDPDPQRIDVRRTIAGHMRGGDPALFVPARRRELPTILLLTDSSAGAAHWNTLSKEFEKILHARGVTVERIVFPSGGFFATKSGLSVQRPEALDVERLVGQPGWTVTFVFSEAHRLGRSDILFFRRLTENGPLIFLDMRDRRLWDRRHAALQAAGVRLVEATAEGLRYAMAEVFAPDRVRAALSEPAMTGAPPSFDVFDTLGNEGRLWASDCALVEPISFALAERLRARYPDLKTSSPSLAFSRLAALPGSWTGPDGLNFEPPTRRLLLSLFASRDDNDRGMTMAIIDAAFAEASPEKGSSAKLVHTYAKTLAHVFADNIDAAIEQIVRIEAGGTLYQAPIRDFVDRLRPPSQDVESQQSLIKLPYEPQSAAVRCRLRSTPPEGSSTALSRPPTRADRYLQGGLEIAPARWSLGLPSSRARLTNADGRPVTFDQRPSWGAFFFGGRHLLLAGVSDQLVVFDTFLGRMFPIDLSTLSSETAAIATGWNAPVAVIGARSACQVIRLESGLGMLPATLRAEPLKIETEYGRGAGSGRPILAVDPSGRFAFVGESGQPDLLRCPLGDGERQSLWRFSDPVTAVTTADTSVLVGLANGIVYRESVETIENSSSEPAFSIEGSPNALALARIKDERDADADISRELLVASTESGMLVCHDRQGQLSSMRASASVRRVVAFAAREAVAIRGGGGQPPLVTGLSVAVLGNEGSFDIVGMPISATGRDGQAAFTAMSLLNRPVQASDPVRRALAVAGQSSRVAILVNETGGKPRIEVRPLDYMLPALSSAVGRLTSGTETDVSEPADIASAQNVSAEPVERETVSLAASSPPDEQADGLEAAR
ncbi:hypothetical protein NKJ84_16095 [Mesorhizobium sp. M0048]|uniref:hypothetical protein n=1 Tax=Mesorhizobium sp. M0048 TaxID=2956860 RepID=UPI00333998A3